MSNQELFGKQVNWLTALYFLVFGVILVLTAHGDVVLWLNERHTPFFDAFFKYWTYLGDGVLLGVLGLGLLLSNYYRFLTFMIAVALQTVFVHVFKQWLSAGEPRPKTFFADQIDTLNFVEGVTVRGYDSFPSGHTASGFVLFFFLILLVKNKALKTLCFVTAVLVGLSRIYLIQHFARDVYVGSLFGVIAVVISVYLMRNQSEKTKLQRGLLKR
ncbi:phosphatase PAP2 family protein [Roseivirga sp. E12]|uniref:phosphatase PAP2 family protein n=1 Tax=Roseivirga sp. E12 TaxID=2819237 RepID=UPI001ABCE779|nr:phosphatase PAP2 family protein [Roseivirga sp. E12]MBO3697321.1 phosphatase PAP2 family protein [Roseivirga sp. E12]